MKTKILATLLFHTALFISVTAAQPKGNAIIHPVAEEVKNNTELPKKNSGCINFSIKNIKTDKGVIYLAFYKEPETFLKKHGESFAKPVTPTGIPTQNAEVCDLEPGWYAVAVMQDLDRDGDMKFNVLGMPKEPYGFSNGVHPFLRAPRFKECSFYIEPGAETTVNVSMINP